jgi:hypothetical protein
VSTLRAEIDRLATEFADDLCFLVLASIAAQASAKAAWLKGKGWTIRDTRKPTGLEIECPNNQGRHRYVGRTLDKAMDALKDAREDACPFCTRAKGLLPFL